MIEFKLLNGNKKAPERMTEGAAGFDFYLHKEIVIEPFSRALVPLSVACAIPPAFVGILDGRSSLYKKYGLDSTTGYIDSDYRGEIHLQITNNEENIVTLKSGERVGQMIVLPFLGAGRVVEELDETDRGKGGFGSTGK